MREFEYFLFENFDADEEAANPWNPRNFLGKGTDPILSMVAEQELTDRDARSLFGPDLVQKLMDSGVLRCDHGMLAFDCPIFLKEDAAVLYRETAKRAKNLMDLLAQRIPEIRTCCRGIDNGFSPETNLYHILCGMIFDGQFFDYLSQRKAVATERKHTSGLDYLSVIYEKCQQLHCLSDGLLCSYNRFANESCSLQSFGDAKGNRLDFYRLFRLMEGGRIPAEFQRAAALVDRERNRLDKNRIFSEVVSLVKTGTCDQNVLQLLELLGYTDCGEFCVPVFRPGHRKYIAQMEEMVENCLGDAFSKALCDLADTAAITAVRHGVNGPEIANELYHILFGMMNEELVSRGIVEAPNLRPGEGRYLKCVELMWE